jgi:hypothetical protein
MLSTYGTWKVTTEGDVEGRSTRQLGVFQGHIDEIAFALADKAFYALKFEKVEPLNIGKAFTRASVEISIYSDDDGFTGSDRTRKCEDLFIDRPVRVEPNGQYGTVTLVAGRTAAETSAIKAEITRQTALAKLSVAERRALGLE